MSLSKSEGVSIQRRSLSKGGLCPGWGSLSRWRSLSIGSLSKGSLSRGVSVQGVSVQSGLSPKGFCPGESLSKGESLSRGPLSRGFSLQGRLCLGVYVRETPHMVMCRQYACYWNVATLRW